MRLGLLGPAGGDVGALGRAAEYLLNTARVSRVIYLGNDGTLDRAVAAWAERLVGADPTDEGAWARAVDVALSGTPDEIDRFVATERARLRLKALEALPEDGARAVEQFGERIALLIHDKAVLDEEDIVKANLLFYGKSDAPLVRRIGSRWFVSPGPIGAPRSGVAVLDDNAAGARELVVTISDAEGNVGHREALSSTRTSMRVQGGP